jgi:hypothetical protein
MTWIKFLTWLFGLYTAYYSALIFWDQFRSKNADTQNEKHELTFAEEVVPIKPHLDENSPDRKQYSVYSSGGISLKQMFNLAREEVIEYTKPVSF